MKRIRLLALALLAAGLLATPVLAAGGASSVAARPALDREILAQLNQVRAAHGLSRLRSSRPLSASAAQHTLDMLEHGFFAHRSSGGGSFATRVVRFYPSSGFKRWLTGETILWDSPDVGAGAAVLEWLNSPEHHRILLDPTWREVGISAIHATTAPGTYQGREVTVITADFGLRTR
jgi:uncharacterized protein YkwD